MAGLRVIRSSAVLRRHFHQLSACMSAPVSFKYQSLIKRYAQTSASTARNPRENSMFCYQCEQTKSRKGCTTVGVCGKTGEVAALQDLLVHCIKGLALYGHLAAREGAKVPAEAYDFTFSAIFSTLTNVNFDPNRFPTYINEALSWRERLQELYEQQCLKKGASPQVFTHSAAIWLPPKGKANSLDVLESEGKKVGVLSELAEYNADVNGVRQLIIYGLKGMATYARHARLLGEWDDAIGAFCHETLAFMQTGDEMKRKSLAVNLDLALKVGEWNLKGLELLDKGHRKKFGVPSPTQVHTTPIPGKAILVSGHDMHDLELILKGTEGTGINVYTHGEMLPAHGYPGLREYKHLAGHYGGAWQLQKFDFAAFPGPIVMTTNCLIEPLKAYKNRLFTLNDTGWPGCRHVSLPDDLDLVLAVANDNPGFTEDDCKRETKTLPAGFGHEAILDNIDLVLRSVENGSLKRVFVIGGCDGAEQKRNYFTTLADSLPNETLILTMGCAKYRFNRHDFGFLGDTGIPRLLDLGQCNDSYGAVLVASALAKTLGTDLNSLPLSITLSWFEQKAVAVLLSLLHLGVKNIRIGPVLPAFITPTVLEKLVKKYNIIPIDVRHPKEDLELMMHGKRLLGVK